MATPWIKNYESGVPETIDPSIYRSLVDLFFTTCEKHQDHIAYENFGTQLTYGSLKKKSLAFASFLQQSGLKKGDRVAIMMPNLLQYPIALFGILCAGGIVVNTNPLYTADELTHQLKDSGATFLLVFNHLSPTVIQAIPSLPLKKLIITNLGDCLPSFKRVALHFYLKYIKKLPSLKQPPAFAITFDEAITLGQAQNYQPVELNHHDLAFLQYTGGTTGTAKGAMLSHKNMIANVLQAYTWVTPLKIGSDDIVVTALPLYHIFALTANCLTFLRAGAKNVLITNPRDIKSVINTLKAHPFTAFTGVNTLFNALLNHPKFQSINFSHLKLTLSGGMALQKVIAQTWHDVTKTRILEAYGLTETSPAVTINPMYMDDYNGSIGLPLPSTIVSIRNEEGEPVPLGEVGELCVYGPQVMLGYWNQPEETKQVMTEDGFLKTGDLGRMDEQGFVYLVDRKKDLIIVSGFNVYPNEVEQVIGRHPDVLEVGVTSMLDDSGSERVKAFVVKKHDDLTEKALIAFCRQHLTPYKVPKAIEFRTTLPKTAVGKILRRALPKAAELETDA